MARVIDVTQGEARSAFCTRETWRLRRRRFKVGARDGEGHAAAARHEEWAAPERSSDDEPSSKAWQSRWT